MKQIHQIYLKSSTGSHGCGFNTIGVTSVGT